MSSKIEISSPCNKTCKLNNQLICIGCGRSISEIISWNSAVFTVKKDILTKAQERLKNSLK